MKTAPLIVIVGETASGKTDLALRLAGQFNGEIIAADSRTVYRGMDIGTAKPTAEEQARVRHHLLDVAEPDQKFTAADFKKLAQEAIKDITKRGKLPIMAGGSGLYIDSVLYDYKFRRPAESTARDYLSSRSVEELQLMLLERGLPMPNNPRNPRHLIRTIETDGLVSSKKELRPETLIIGLQPDRQELKHKIIGRVGQMLKSGLIDEIKVLVERYGWEAEALQVPGYRAFRSYLEGEETLDEARQKFIQNDLHLAKRQRTWFKRNKSIQWYSTPVKWTNVVERITTFLNT